MNQTINFKNYRFRSHAVGRIASGMVTGLTDNQAKEFERLEGLKKAGKLTDKQVLTFAELFAKKNAKPGLTEGVKNYLQDLHREEVFNRRKILETRQVEKGLAVEAKSISLYMRLFPGDVFFRKNTERFKNGFFSGLPDNIQGTVKDFKSSWNLETFPMFEKVITNKAYYWQLQTYMDLLGMDQAELIYCLIDTPYNLIDDALRSLNWKYNITDVEGNVLDGSVPLVVEKVSNMLYTWEALREYCDRPNAFIPVSFDWFKDQFKEIPEALRCNVLKLERNDEDLTALKKQVVECRKYLNTLSEELADKLSGNAA